MRFISNGFYFLIAIIAILWSFASSFEKDGSSRPKSDSFSNKNITSIKTNLRSLPKFTIQSESKIRRQGGSGTAFYVGQDTWVTARHVINQCPKVMMSFGKKQMIIKDIYIHPNSDLVDLPYFEITRYKEEAFSSGYPAGNPGDLALNYLGHVGYHHSVLTQLVASVEGRLFLKTID